MGLRVPFLMERLLSGERTPVHARVASSRIGVSLLPRSGPPEVPSVEAGGEVFSVAHGHRVGLSKLAEESDGECEQAFLLLAVGGHDGRDEQLERGFLVALL